jgi:hypothetical protein
MIEAQPHWERAEAELRQRLGSTVWKTMKQTVSQMAEATAPG